MSLTFLPLHPAPGAELAHAERATDFTTTNTSNASVAAASLVGGLEFTIVGQGRPVEIDFWAGLVRHSVASSFVMAYFVVNGVAGDVNLGTGGATSSPSTSTGRVLSVKRRVVLTRGTSYTFQVGICGQAGTSTLQASAPAPVTFGAVQR